MATDAAPDASELSLRPLSGYRSLGYFVLPGLLVGLGVITSFLLVVRWQNSE